MLLLFRRRPLSAFLFARKSQPSCDGGTLSLHRPPAPRGSARALRHNGQPCRKWLPRSFACSKKAGRVPELASSQRSLRRIGPGRSEGSHTIGEPWRCSGSAQWLAATPSPRQPIEKAVRSLLIHGPRKARGRVRALLELRSWLSGMLPAERKKFASELQKRAAAYMRQKSRPKQGHSQDFCQRPVQSI